MLSTHDKGFFFWPSNDPFANLIVFRPWDPTDATFAGTGSINNLFAAAHNAMKPLRQLTPGGGAYQNEADTFEPDPAGSFWGMDNYYNLLAWKQKMDPQNLLTCHQCIGWDKTDARYSCYPADPNGS
jgi:hypothetical protein